MSLQTMSLDRADKPAGSSSRWSARVTRSSALPPSAPYTGSQMAREPTMETSIAVLYWDANATTSSAASALAKAPILRDVPQVKRKLTRHRERDSLQGGSIDVLPMSNAFTGPADPKLLSSLKHATPSWLREKPSKAKLLTHVGMGHTRTVGAWRKATLTCRETGVILLFGEDRAMHHSLNATELSASDIRLVDDSLFSRPHVLGIFARPSTLTAGVRSTSAGASSPGSKSREAPIYICFASSRKLFKWRSVLRAFARPEIYGPLQGTVGRYSHRTYHSVEISLHDLKIFSDKAHAHDKAVRSHAPVPGQLISPESPLRPQEVIDDVTGNLGASSRSSLDLPDASQPVEMQPQSVDVAETEDGKASDGVNRSKSSLSIDEHATFGTSLNATPSKYTTDSAPFHQSATFSMDRRGSEDSSYNISSRYHATTPRYSLCQVWMEGEVMARTKVETGTSNMAWFDRFHLQDLPRLSSLHVEVLQAWRVGKFVQLGTVDIPLETMRRGEKIEGRFPVWAPSYYDDIYARRDEYASSYGKEMTGELKLVINVQEQTVLPLSKYVDVIRTLNGPDCVDLMRKLCRELDEDRVISHLVDVYTTGGTIVQRLTDMIHAESSTFASEPALLFRGNTLLSRAIDKYQRRYCIDWLETCVGDTVRRVCTERIRLEMVEMSHLLNSSALGAGHSGTSISTGYSEASVEILRSLSRELWQSIYSNRHRCPPELRCALAAIRRTVNSHFDQSPGPGVQGVGAFVFLRLICPAITTPNLYGLMGSAPDAHSAKTLMMLAKVFLALANKRSAFDRDKEPWLIRLNDFLTSEASAYDDFITIISTEAEGTSRFESLGDEKDLAFQSMLHHRINGMSKLHREAIPPAGLKLDHALALAMMVSYVVREASGEPIDGDTADSHVDVSMPPPSNVGDQSTLADGSREPLEASMDILNDFIDMCCDLEDQVGYHLDRAGFDPDPLPIRSHDGLDGVQRTTSVFTSHKGGATPENISTPLPAATVVSSPSRTIVSPPMTAYPSTPPTRLAQLVAMPPRAMGMTRDAEQSSISSPRNQLPVRRDTDPHLAHNAVIGTPMDRTNATDPLVQPAAWTFDSMQHLSVDSLAPVRRSCDSDRRDERQAVLSRMHPDGHELISNDTPLDFADGGDVSGGKKKRGWWRRKR